MDTMRCSEPLKRRQQWIFFTDYSSLPTHSLHTSQVAHQDRTYSGFCSIKQLEAFLIPLDGMLVHHRVTPSSETHLYTWVKRGTMSKESCPRTQCRGPAHHEPRLINPEASALTIRSTAMLPIPPTQNYDIILKKCVHSDQIVRKSAYESSLPREHPHKKYLDVKYPGTPKLKFLTIFSDNFGSRTKCFITSSWKNSH